jgi:hypothetical protein
MANTIAAPAPSRLTRKALRSLAEAPAEPSVSLFMPMLRSGPEVRQNAVRLRNLLRDAASRAHQLKESNGDARALAGELSQLLHEESVEEYAAPPSGGLALFIRSGFVQAFKAPVDFEERVYVSSRFHVTPLLEFLQCNGRFFVLAVSQKDVRLFQGDKHSIVEVNVAKLPKNLFEALNIDEFIQSTQFHTVAPGGRQTLNHGGGMFHGHGGSDQGDKKGLILEYFRRLDDALVEFFHDETAPLVFAGVDYLFPLYQQSNHYRSLVDAPIVGNPEGWNRDQLHGPAWNIVKSYFDAARRSAIEEYGTLAAHGQASDDIVEVIEAARIGRVGRLLISRGAQQFGVVDPDTGAVRARLRNLASYDGHDREDLLDYVAALTLATSGEVYLLDQSEMPTASPVAGLYRY